VAAWVRATAPLLATALAVLVLVGCATEPSGAREHDTLRITGALTYLPRVALPPDSIAVVELREGPDPDDAIVAEQRIALKGRQVPVPFELTVDGSLLARQPEYAFRGGIVHRGEPIWLTDTVPVSVNVGHVELGTLRMTTHRPGSAPGGAPGTLGAPPEALGGGEWQIIELDGEHTLRDARPTLLFEASGYAGGHGSCNRYSGPYRVDGTRLRFGDLASTMMACEDPVMRQERRLFDLLAGVRRYRLDDDGTLVLETDDGRTLLARHSPPDER